MVVLSDLSDQQLIHLQGQNGAKQTGVALSVWEMDEHCDGHSPITFMHVFSGPDHSPVALSPHLSTQCAMVYLHTQDILQVGGNAEVPQEAGCEWLRRRVKECAGWSNSPTGMRTS